MLIGMRADLVWCPWTAHFSGLNCSATDRRFRCCLPDRPPLPNCAGNQQSRPRAVLLCNSTHQIDASRREPSLGINWYLIFLVSSIVIFVGCIIFRMWHLFHRCLNADDVTTAAPSRNLSTRRSSADGSTFTLNIHGYAEGLEMSELREETSLDSDRPLEVPSAPPDNDLPPTYDDLAPAVVNFPGVVINDQPPAYDTLTPPPTYDEARARMGKIN